MSTKTIRGSVNDLTGDEIYVTESSKLKTLNQSMFDGLDEKWQYIGIEGYGDAFAYNLPVESFGWQLIHTLTDSMTDRLHLGKGFDTDDWENSTITRDKSVSCNWISVDDRLPNVRGYCLTLGSNDDVEFAVYTQDRDGFYFASIDAPICDKWGYDNNGILYGELINVKYWFPLPNLETKK